MRISLWHNHAGSNNPPVSSLSPMARGSRPAGLAGK